MELQNSTVLVTGATGNMGPYVTDAFVDRGADVVGVDPDIERRPERPDEIDDFYADTSKCERLFGRAPDTSFDEGLERTYEWLQSELDL